jgi:hypothetical protein
VVQLVQSIYKFIPLTTQIHDHSLSWLGTGTSIKSGRYGGIFVSIIFFFMCYRSTKDVKGQRKKDARHAVNMARKT